MPYMNAARWARGQERNCLHRAQVMYEIEKKVSGEAFATAEHNKATEACYWAWYAKNQEICMAAATGNSIGGLIPAWIGGLGLCAGQK